MTTANERYQIKADGEPISAQVQHYEVNGEPYLMLEVYTDFMATIVFFEGSWIWEDDGDGESGPMPHRSLGPWKEIGTGGGGAPGEDLLLQMLVESEPSCEFCHDHHWLQRREGESFPIGVCFGCEDSEESTKEDREAMRFFRQERRVWINIYEIGREYGGPEEGGWYYNTSKPVVTCRAGVDRAEEVADALRSTYTYPDHDVWVQPFEGMTSPKDKPRN